MVLCLVKAHAQFVSHMLLRRGLMLRLKVGNVILALSLRGFLHLGCLSQQLLPMNLSPTISSSNCGVCMWSGWLISPCCFFLFSWLWNKVLTSNIIPWHQYILRINFYARHSLALPVKYKEASKLETNPLSCLLSLSVGNTHIQFCISHIAALYVLDFVGGDFPGNNSRTNCALDQFSDITIVQSEKFPPV